LVEKEDKVYLGIGKEIVEKEATTMLGTLAKRQGLAVVSAYTGQRITSSNWSPIRTFTAQTFTGTKQASLDDRAQFATKERTCFQQEERMNLLLSGRIRWDVSYANGKFKALKLAQQDHLLSPTFMNCMETALAATQLNAPVSGTMTFSLN
jgi:hypothetical protein